MARAIDKVKNCETMTEVRAGVNALDDILVPLLVERGGYMTQAAKVKNDENLVYDQDRIDAIIERVRPQAEREGGNADLIERLYRAMITCYIDYEHEELARMRAAGLKPRTASGSNAS
ncbi:chorismate mutase [Diaphorobacter ruginosibacter]|jgi:isochorismate pyruvate lyase|uniref:chorismate mutase n=1 Tax=Diaphorobacter ruginosibacter TaxID=1715720 RepID=A0A7G9RPW8_9BURK|nr:chorismate mutase [Diaphorobacter ruginosibacter]MDR2333228.1 chorismate mutase [Burkholderiaceae bacterium]QNN57643.1 chorismate mutase [Diaphorobacter ruginosibacter]